MPIFKIYYFFWFWSSLLYFLINLFFFLIFIFTFLVNVSIDLSLFPSSLLGGIYIRSDVFSLRFSAHGFPCFNTCIGFFVISLSIFTFFRLFDSFLVNDFINISLFPSSLFILFTDWSIASVFLIFNITGLFSLKLSLFLLLSYLYVFNKCFESRISHFYFPSPYWLLIIVLGFIKISYIIPFCLIIRLFNLIFLVISFCSFIWIFKYITVSFLIICLLCFSSSK